MSAFIQTFETLGYAVCQDGRLEAGHEKVAIYAKGTSNPEPTHAARQLANGQWTSKLGQLEDIEHDTPETVEGPSYGKAILFMKRKNVLF